MGDRLDDAHSDCRYVLTCTDEDQSSGPSEMADIAAPVEHHRGSWASPIEFIMSCMNYAIGLGNVWRFPYLAYRNGGGAFLGPYVIMLFLIGLPIFFLELAIGQYAGLGPIEAFQRISPIFHGLGYCTLVVITLITIYYQVIVAWAMFYIFASFSSELKWGSCMNSFNSPHCFSESADEECRARNESEPYTFFNRTCQSVAELCKEHGYQPLPKNASYCLSETNNTFIPLKTVLKRVLSSEEYYNDHVLGRKNATWEDWGQFQWQLALCLFLSWCVLYGCLARGVQSSGKAAYFTAIFPVVLLSILLIRGVTLDGALNGVTYYVTPRWETLLDAAVWGDAASQVFYSFGIGCGSLITLSSYSKFSNNCHTDAIIVSVTNLATAVFAGFAVFTVMGFLAAQQGVTVTDVVSSGPGLAFIVYPEAILRMPTMPQLWAVLFFFMLFVLGLGSQFAGVQAITTAMIDKWPNLRARQWLVTLLVCLGCFILELPMCYSGGVYLFTLMDWNTASWAILLIGFAEIIAVSWVYGCSRFMENLNEMGIQFYGIIAFYWRFVWVIASPFMSIAVFVFVMIQYVPASYGSYEFPLWADTIGWLISISTLAPFPIFALYRVLYGKEVGMDLLRASPLWCPREDGTKVVDEERSSDFREGVKLECLNGNGHIITQFVYDNVAFARDNAALKT